MAAAGDARRRRWVLWLVVGAGLLSLSTCAAPSRPVERTLDRPSAGRPPEPAAEPEPSPEPEPTGEPGPTREPDPRPGRPASGPGRGTVTLAFAGDVHFEQHLASLPSSGTGLGPITRTLAGADVAMVNLESAVTRRGRPDPKELEQPGNRYHFRTSPAALDFLAEAGVDAVSMANNHGADYGPEGLRDSLRAATGAPLAVLGIGADRREAFAPLRVDVRGTRLALLAADASFRESAGGIWAAGPDSPGVAAAREARPRTLLRAVRSARRTADVVVVYLHWGAEYQSCPTDDQRSLSAALARVGADVVVGTHTHVLLGSGWHPRHGRTYVNYGLSGFLWYHDFRPETGVLVLRVRDGRVVADDWVPALIRPDGRPQPVVGPARAAALAAWDTLRGCTGLRREAPPLRPPYRATVRRIDPATRERLSASHRPGCPVAVRDLRLLRMRYVGFDGRTRTGEMVLAARYARDVVGVFEELYDARWPIRRMRLVDAYGGDDDRSMAADNSSAYNCRTVAGQPQWSDHAYGAAIDLNPVRNPYLTPGSVAPPAGRRFADLDRSAGARVPAGVIRRGDVVVRAFAGIGWEWGGDWADPDYQHFAARDAGGPWQPSGAVGSRRSGTATAVRRGIGG